MRALPNILVVDDHDDIRDSVIQYLVQNGFAARGAADATAMDTEMERLTFDLVVLDVMMPGEDGIAACRRLRSRGETPILMLSARGDDEDRIRGLDTGADDYLAKPFNPQELLARIRAILRRSQSQATNAASFAGKKVQFGPLVLDPDLAVIRGPNGRSIELTSGELALLSVFLRRPRIVLSRDELLENTSGRRAGPLDRTIDNQISRLRRKIDPGGPGPRLIRTVRYGGYCLACDVEIIG